MSLHKIYVYRYEQQVQTKLDQGQLPMGVPFKVYSDPGGIRTGDGGATLNIIYELHKETGDDLFKKKILMIHAGGYSKRLPSHRYSMVSLMP